MHMRFIATAAALAGLLGANSSHAVTLNPRGLGQALVFPYYTVNKGLDTLIAFDNDSAVGKLVNVRFLEGYNGRTVLDFNVWLGPYDGWIGSISGDGQDNAAARLFSTDRSCSNVVLSPALAFSTTAFDGSSESSPADGGPTDASRTREGHFEVIAIGDIPAGSDTESAVREFHCADINANAPLLPPTPTLFGAGTIVDVSNGYFYGYNADALTGFTDKVLSRDPPGPTLADANSTASSHANGALATILDDSGNALTIDYPRGIDAVTAVYMAGSVTNEYNILPGLGASTDWVVTFPTKRFYVDKQLYPSTVTHPFLESLSDDAGRTVMTATYGHIPLDHDIRLSQARCAGTPDAECLDTYYIQRFRYDVNIAPIVPFPGGPASGPSKIFGSRLLPPYNIAILLDGAAELGSGWLRVDFSTDQAAGGILDGGERSLASGQRVAVQLRGAPATGFMVYNVVNANVSGGRLANYGGAFAHRMSAPTCEQGNGESCPMQ